MCQPCIIKDYLKLTTRFPCWTYGKAANTGSTWTDWNHYNASKCSVIIANALIVEEPSDMCMAHLVSYNSPLTWL